MDLSEKRAQATVAHLVSKGISEDRLTAIGFGDTKLLNECGVGIACPEEKHRVNRRVELTVIQKSIEKQ